MNYLLLSKIKVQSANAMAGVGTLINTAPIMAINLFVHNLGLKTNLTPTGVAIIHHDAQLLGEHSGNFYNFHPHQRRGAVFIDKKDYSSKNKYALSLQPTASCHLTLSLIIKCDAPAETTAVERFLQRARIAGGGIVSYESVRSISSLDELHDTCPNGYWLVERQDLMEQQQNPLDALFAVIGRRHYTNESQVENNGEDLSEGEQPLPSSWLVPTVLGYSTITEFTKRGGVRALDNGEVPLHAFCEPLIGLAQYVSQRHYGNRPIPFWHHRWVQGDVFVVQQVNQI